MILRTALEALSRGVVLRRRLPRQFGGHVLYVTPAAALAFWRPNLSRVDPRLFRLVQAFVRPGMKVWDLGANVGLFTMAAAACATREGHVLAVEPDEWLVSLIRRSAAHGDPDRAPVDVLAAAVDSSLCVASFCVAKRGLAASHIATSNGSSQAGGIRERRTVVTVTLDWLLQWFPQPQLVKVDIEGAERRSLAAAPRLLGEVRPILVVEVAPANFDPIGVLLHKFEYVLFDGEHADPLESAIAKPAWSTVAIPRGHPFLVDSSGRRT